MKTRLRYLISMLILGITQTLWCQEKEPFKEAFIDAKIFGAPIQNKMDIKSRISAFLSKNRNNQKEWITKIQNEKNGSENYVIRNNNIMIEVYTSDNQNPDAFAAALKALGFVTRSQHDKILLGRIPIDSLERLYTLEEVSAVIPVTRLLTNTTRSHPEGGYVPYGGRRTDFKDFTGFGAANNQGSVAMKADQIRKRLKVSGKNVKIGIISSSFDLLGNARKGIENGDLPGLQNPNGFKRPVTVLEEGIIEGLSGPSIDEGRGMAELIHDIAPEAQLFFSTGFVGSDLAFADAIKNLAAAGCDIIVDDVFLGTRSSVYQEGLISETIENVTDRGVLYFTSAGNFGDGSTRNIFKFYESAYAPAEVDFPGQGILLFHIFETGSPFLPVQLKKGTSTLNIEVQWSEPWGSRCKGCAKSKYDLNIVAFDGNSNILELAQPNVKGDARVGTNFTFESTADNIIGIGLITLNGGTLPERVFIGYDVINSSAIILEEDTKKLFQNTPTVYGHNNAASAITVGASSWFNTPEGAIYWNANIAGTVSNGQRVDRVPVPKIPILSYPDAPSAIFSSQTLVDPITTKSSIGGIGLLFDNKGNLINANGKPKINKKPDVVGPDGVSNTVSGLTNNIIPNRFFFGTSAAAPNVAALAALLLQASNYTFDQAEMRKVLNGTAIDMDDPYIMGLQRGNNSPRFSKGFDFASGNGFVDAVAAADKIIKTIRTRDLLLTEVCSKDVANGRLWEVNNRNAFAIEATVRSNKKIKLPNKKSFQKGPKTYMAAPGISYIMTEEPNATASATRLGIKTTRAFKFVISGERLKLCNPNKNNVLSVTLSPNPATADKNAVTIILNGFKGIGTTIKLFDFNGALRASRSVKPTTNRFKTMLDIRNIPKGKYVIKVISKSKTISKQLIKK